MLARDIGPANDNLFSAHAISNNVHLLYMTCSNVLGGGSESPSFVLGATLPNSHNQMQSHKRMSMGHAGGPPGHLLRGSGSGDVRGGVLQPSKRMNLLGKCMVEGLHETGD